MTRSKLIHHLQTLIGTRIDELQREIFATYAARNDDTKSSAGDKHEVGRAMIQQELDKQEGQLAKQQEQLSELARIPVDRKYDQAGFGSLVSTDSGTYFIAIGLGQIRTEEGTCFVVSMDSPIGQLLKNKRVGDTVEFNCRRMVIKEIC